MSGIELKAKVSAENLGYQFSDTAYLRFLRGRKHIVENALKGMVRHVQWRNDEGVASITTDDCRNEIATGKIRVIVVFNRTLIKNSLVVSFSPSIQVEGRDISGKPVIYIFARKHNKDARDIIEMKKFIIYTLETAIQQTLPHEEKMIIVFDLTGFTLQCMDYEVLKMLIDILQYNYPETLGTAYVVNSPFLFWACWAIIKPWLDPVTAAKAQFVNASDVPKLIDQEFAVEEFAQAYRKYPVVVSGAISVSGTVSTSSSVSDTTAETTSP